jgi:predicted MFS family arabinose efflux permease
MTSPASSPTPDGAALAEWRRGWPVVAAATFGYGTGGAMFMMTAGLFIKPMRDALGWSTAAVTIAPIISLVWAFSSPFAGAVVDKFGSRPVALVAAIALMLCAIALATAPITSVTFYSIAVLIGIIGPMTNIASYARGIATWFRYSFGTALGVTLNGVSLVALISVPAVSAAIFNYGWRAGYVALAGIILVLGVPIVFALFRERPQEDTGQGEVSEPLSGYTLAEAMRDARFWAFVAAFGIGSIPLGGFLGHLQPLLASQGFGIAEATGLGVLYAVSVSIGRITGGVLLDRFWDCAVAGIMFALAGLGGLALGHLTIETTYLIVGAIVFLIGMGQGAEADFIAYFGRRTFGLRAYSTLLGTLAMASSLGMAAGGFSFAKLFDLQGNYLLACYLGGASFLLAGFIIFAVGLGEKMKVWRIGTA